MLFTAFVAKIHDWSHKNSVLDMKLCESAPSLERLTSLGCSKSVMRVSGDASMGAWEGPERAQSTQNLYCHLGVGGGGLPITDAKKLIILSLKGIYNIPLPLLL